MPKASLGSYQVTHGTVRPAPAKSMEGASASFVGSMLSDAGKPCVTHGTVLEGAHEDLLRAADLLLEGRPRHLELAGGDGATGDVRDTGVLVGVDRVERVVVYLRAVGRQGSEGRVCGHAKGEGAGDEGRQRERPWRELHQRDLLPRWGCEPGFTGSTRDVARRMQGARLGIAPSGLPSRSSTSLPRHRCAGRRECAACRPRGNECPSP